MDLSLFGWNTGSAQHFAPYREQGLLPARVVREDRELYTVHAEVGELAARVSGRFRHLSVERASFPAVGDWVAIEPRLGEHAATIHAVLPRKSRFSRKVAGSVTEEQVVAANVDAVLIVAGLDGEFEPRRFERYLTLAWDSGADPLIILNKADLVSDAGPQLAEVEAIAFGVPIHIVSAVTGEGLDGLLPTMQEGQTLVLLGSSGVGKSTLINALLGEDLLAVGVVRENDSKGRHTTTRRQLVRLPTGGLLIDTPGMRELQLWTDEEHLDWAFDDIEVLAAQCRFRDCSHRMEPGCAVRAAIEEGRLAGERLDSYYKLQRELRYLASRQDERIRRQIKEQSIRRARYGRRRKQLRDEGKVR